MKIVIAILLIIGVSITAHSQNFVSFSKLFSEVKVPYIIPEGSYFGYTNDDAKRPVVGKAIDNATYKAIFGLDMETYATWQAVGKITK